MPTDNRRQSQRIAFAGSVLLSTQRGPVAAEIRDLSRSGIRIRVRADALGFPPSPHLAPSAKNIRASLGAEFELDLHEDVLGPLVRRRAIATHIGIPRDCPEALDLGCRFAKGLTDDEIEILGAELPADSSWEDLAFNERWMRFKQGQFRAYVNARISLDPALACETKSVSENALRVWCRSDGNRLALGNTEDILKTAVRFSERFGDYVELRVTQGADDVWSGCAHVSGVEINPDKPRVMLLTLTFGRALAAHERARFGLSA